MGDSPSTRVSLVRHGLVENPKQVLYGRLPGFNLSDTGRQQAETVALRLKDARLEAIWSSPMERARQTAERIAAYHPRLEVGIDERLHEVRWGRQGIPGAEFNSLRPRCYDADVMLPGDETLEAITERTRAFLADQAARFPGGHVVAVSHGDPIAVARALAAHRPLTVADFERDYPGPASITDLLAGADGALELVRGIVWAED